MADLADSLARRFAVVRPHLSEFARRLWLGAEGAALGAGGGGAGAGAAGGGGGRGRGGVAGVAAGTGVAAETVRRGRKEAEDAKAPAAGRSRAPGGGRKRAETHDEDLVSALEAMIDPVTRGDPMSPLRWTSKSLRTLTAALRENGHQVSEFVVRRLLRELGYSLQANAKTAEGGRHPDRDAQFGYLNDQAQEFMAAGDAVISVDTKKKELVGTYKNGGREWTPAGEPEQVKVHDFLDPALGKANPYGVYDVGTNTGWVSVGTDHATAPFRVTTPARGGGGATGDRPRRWKTELAALASASGLTITVCHLPPGTSKWNKIEHRLFSHISMNWRGRPLTSHEVVVNTIAATTTRTGLTVTAELDTGSYPKGIKITDEQMRDVERTTLRRHEFHGEWNYSLAPGW